MYILLYLNVLKLLFCVFLFICSVIATEFCFVLVRFPCFQNKFLWLALVLPTGRLRCHVVNLWKQLSSTRKCLVQHPSILSPLSSPSLFFGRRRCLAPTAKNFRCFFYSQTGCFPSVWKKAGKIQNYTVWSWRILFDLKFVSKLNFDN